MPDAPGKPRVVGVTSTTVTLEWDPIKGASSYVVSISDLRRLTEVQTEDTRVGFLIRSHCHNTRTLSKENIDSPPPKSNRTKRSIDCSGLGLVLDPSQVDYSSITRYDGTAVWMV